MAIPQPTNFKETAQRILGNADKYEIYSLAIHIRNGMAERIKSTYEYINETFKHRYSIIGENQFVEWWHTQIKYWNIELEDETPEPLTFDELVTRFPKKSITAEYWKIIHGVDAHVKKTYRKHLNDYGNSPNEWDKLQNNEIY